MKIRKIFVVRGTRLETYENYMALISRKRIYWQAMQPEKYQQLKAHLIIVHGSEYRLEDRYQLPRYSLKGANLIFGSIRDMREAMTNAEFRRKVSNDEIVFLVKLDAVTRIVNVYTEEDSVLAHYKQYQISHNFFGPALIADPVAEPG